MYVKLNGKMVYLWRAVDQEGEVLESFVTRTRDKAAALTFMNCRRVTAMLFLHPFATLIGLWVTFIFVRLD